MTTNNLSASVSEQANAVENVSARQVANFAWQHLKAATTFRDHAAALEAKYKGEAFGDFFVEIRSYVSSSVLSATAGLEAHINELFIAPHCKLRPLLPDFETAFWGKNGIEEKRILDKYKKALCLINAPRLKNSPTYNNTWALVELRNALVHYKPTWDPDRQKKVELLDAVKGRYKLSPFVGTHADFVTMQSMSAGCAAWAVTTVLKFLREFDALSNLDPDKMVSFWALEG